METAKTDESPPSGVAVAEEKGPKLGARAPAGEEMKENNWTLDTGVATLRWPARMSAAEFEEFEMWINLQLRTIKRTVPKGD